MLKWAAVVAALIVPGMVAAQARPDQQAFFALYKELVETNTTLSAGSCTLAAAQIATRLKAAGYRRRRHHLLLGPRPSQGRRPRRGPARARDAKAKPMLLLAHLDVVEAKREDWTRDPFTLVEEDGYFYARGTVDDKAMAAVWVDTHDPLQAGRLTRRSARSSWR